MLPCATKSATCGSIFDPARIRRELADIETKLADPALWNDPNASKPLMRDRKRLESMVADDEELLRRTGDIDAYFELAREGEVELLPPQTGSPEGLDRFLEMRAQALERGSDPDGQLGQAALDPFARVPRSEEHTSE